MERRGANISAANIPENAGALGKGKFFKNRNIWKIMSHKKYETRHLVVWKKKLEHF